MKEGDLLWAPSPERIADSNLTAFMRWLERARGRRFDSYAQLHAWSVEDLEGFWGAIWDYFEIEAAAPPECVLPQAIMPGADWFPGARLNFAQHVLRNERPGVEALVYLSEREPPAALSWDELAAGVRVLATHLRRVGVRPGDRVAAYMPNIPQTITAMLAAVSIGAVWASVSPDFGSRGVLDRLSQLQPKVLFCVDGYRYGGRPFDRREELRRIIAGLGSLEHVIYLPHLHREEREPIAPRAQFWSDVLTQPAVSREEFRFEQVPFRHPLWVLFSSGTTGLPKAIVHGHGGILLEQLKLTHLQHDLKPGERMFFYTTTGWMMWNFLVSSMLSKVVPVLYDGNPSYPDLDILWRMVEQTRTAFFGSSPTYVEIMAKHAVSPRRKFDLSSLRAIMPAGSPVTAECSAWFYEHVKEDLWVATGSGGTDFCTGCVGGVPILPVYAGEMQAPALGVAAAAFNERGQPVIGEVGELVITRPMPSMPLFFWGDENNGRYLESYFQDYPGVWRHGDFFRMNERGGCFVLGRSDATLNRYGVRIGTAEVYRAIAAVEEVLDSLIVNLDLPGGHFFMPLFVKLRPGVTLTPALEEKIKERLRTQYTPRHAPDRIYQVEEIPVTLSGKKMEIPVRKILMGVPPEKAANRHTMANPHALDYFVEYARTQRDYSLF